MNITLPAHKGALYIEHNDHKNVYESAAEWLENMGDHYDWQDAESKDRAINSDEIWTMQWYPNTPVGFNAIAAPTLEELLAFANRHEGATNDI